MTVNARSALMSNLVKCLSCLILVKGSLAGDERAPRDFFGSWSDDSVSTAGDQAAMELSQAAIKASSSLSLLPVPAKIATVAPPRVLATPVAKVLGLPTFAAMEEQRRRALKSGSVLVRWRLQYFNLTVYGNIITARFDGKGSFSGKFRGDPESNVGQVDRTARLSESSAVLSVAKAFGFNAMSGANFAFKNVSVERVLRYDNSTANFRLCYKVCFLVAWSDTSKIPEQPHGIVDAITGKLIAYWSGLHKQTETAIRGIGGTVSRPINYTDVVVLKAPVNGKCSYDTSKVQVQNMKSGTSGAFSPASFTCADATSPAYDRVNGGYSPLNDVARNAAVVVSMYQELLGWSGPTGRLPLKARVHFGSNYENAFFDGTYGNFGDGGQSFYPLTSLDIVGHEFSHGFTLYNSALEYVGQSGAISESFSDMAAVAAVFYDTNIATYVIGAGVTKSGFPVRNMCNPSIDGKSIDHVTKYTAGMDVHYSSGVYNKAFCNLAMVWGIATAFQVFALANAYYWTQTTTFALGVCGVRSIATDVGLNADDVVKAFAAVGLACPS